MNIKAESMSKTFYRAGRYRKSGMLESSKPFRVNPVGGGRVSRPRKMIIMRAVFMLVRNLSGRHD